jgi:hypothetical protein
MAQDPVGALEGLAALATSVSPRTKTWPLLVERLRTLGIHPLSVAWAIPKDGPGHTWHGPAQRLAERLGFTMGTFRWDTIGDRTIVIQKGWPAGLKVMPTDLSLHAIPEAGLPPDLTVGGNLRIAVDVPFVLPLDLTVLGNLDLEQAPGWDGKLPDDCRIKGRVHTNVFQGYWRVTGNDRRVGGGVTLQAYRAYERHLAERLARGDSLLTVQREARWRKDEWETL